MSKTYLHERPDFHELLKVLEAETGILIQLIEKDYWIMHCLYGLQKQGFEFELKGGTSLSKGFNIIDRFSEDIDIHSEDIDIHIKPNPDLGVVENPKNEKPNSVKTRKDYYDWLASNIKIDGIVSVERDTTFDDTHAYRSGGVRLFYKSVTGTVLGVKDGILLEVGFDTVAPNSPRLISSWVYDKAASIIGNEIIDTRAKDITCYHPGYTFVEKLQTIATKFRQEQLDGKERSNLMRQYYDVFSLLSHPEVQKFIGTEEYFAHKKNRFPAKDFEIPIAQNEAFLLSDPDLRERFRVRYQNTAALYYKGQPDFDMMLAEL